MKKLLLTFIITLSLWIIFAGRLNIQVFFLGTIICSIISLMLKNKMTSLVQMKFGAEKSFIKIYYIILLISFFIYDKFLSAFRVSKHAFEIKPSFSPRIVRIKTSLEGSNSIAILANLITLTQGTLVMDLDISNRNYYIHWLDIHSDEAAEVKKVLIRKHENLIEKIFD